MKAYDAHADLMTSHIIEQLNELEYFDTYGKTQRELVNVLARLRAMDVIVKSPHADWW